MVKKVRIDFLHSALRQHHTKKATMRALGFKKHVRSVEKDLTDSIRGMITRVQHLVKVTEL